MKMSPVRVRSRSNLALPGHQKTPQVVSEAAAGTAEWVVIGPRGRSKGHGADTPERRGHARRIDHAGETPESLVQFQQAAPLSGGGTGRRYGDG